MTTRETTLFSLRYAVRVLELEARMWGNVNTAIRFVSLTSGMSAVAAVYAQWPAVAMALSAVFAAAQAYDATRNPGEKAWQAKAASKAYGAILANQSRLGDEALERAYLDAVKDDDVSVVDGLRELAYDDVVREKGLPEDGCYDRTKPRPWLRFVSA